MTRQRAPLPRHVLTIIAVADLEVSVGFYRNAFGWPARVRAPVYVELALPDGRGLGLYRRDGFARNTGQLPAELATGDITGTELYLHCHDLDDAMARLRAAGARMLSAPAPRGWGDEAAYFADPDGNVLVLARPMADDTVEEVTRGRGALCRNILATLPDWFGIPAAVEQYVRDVESLSTYAVRAGEHRVGFVSLKSHFNTTTEIHVMGIIPQHHRCGLGRKLIRATEAYARSHGHHLLTVKTLSPSRPTPEYAQTHAFYTAMGFVPVEEFPTLWSEANPCLLMAKSV